ncbi:MAG: branched-chain amino acid ABC transporter permease [Desulfosalsimonas sp.]
MLTKPIHTKLLYLVILAAALLLPWYVPDAYIFQIITMSLIYGVAAAGMNLVLGYTGQVTLAHGAFFGIGAYGVAIMTKAGVSFWLALPLSALISSFIGVLIGLLTLRTRGAYFAIATLCFGVILWIVAGNWIELTGGHNGIFGIPRPSPIAVPFFGSIEFFTQTSMYYLTLALLIIVLFAMHRLVYSVFGLTFMAVRNNEPLADAVGINTFATKLISFVAGNFIAGLAGGMYAAMMGAASPSAAGYMLTFNFLIFVILGGMATLPGPVIGAFAIPVIMEFLQFMKDYRMLIFGALLIAVIIYFPQGFVGGLRRLNQKVASWRQKKTPEI